jgi:hypothetical protein
MTDWQRLKRNLRLLMVAYLLNWAWSLARSDIDDDTAIAFARLAREMQRLSE